MGRRQHLAHAGLQPAQPIQIVPLGLQLLAEEALAMLHQGAELGPDLRRLAGGQLGEEVRGEPGRHLRDGAVQVGNACRLVQMAQAAQIDGRDLSLQGFGLASVDLEVRQGGTVLQQKLAQSGGQAADLPGGLLTPVIGFDPSGQPFRLGLLLVQRVEAARDRLQLIGELGVLLGEPQEHGVGASGHLQHRRRCGLGLTGLGLALGGDEGLERLDPFSKSSGIGRLLVLLRRQQFQPHRQADQFLVEGPDLGGQRQVAGFHGPTPCLDQGQSLVAGKLRLEGRGNGLLLLLARCEPLADRRRSVLVIGELAPEVGAPGVCRRKIGLRLLETKLDLLAWHTQIGIRRSPSLGVLGGGGSVADALRLCQRGPRGFLEGGGPTGVRVDLVEVAHGLAVKRNKLGLCLGLQIRIGLRLGNVGPEDRGGDQDRGQCPVAGIFRGSATLRSNREPESECDPG